MKKPIVCFHQLGEPMPPSLLSGPFAVLIDTRDAEWSSDAWAKNEANELIKANCRYFVCFGPKSETTHDWIDDVIIDSRHSDTIITTFHDNESTEDVVEFFEEVVVRSVGQGLILVQNITHWKNYFSSPKI